MTDKPLTFTVSYARRVQPRNYEHITVGCEETFHKGDVSKRDAFKVVMDDVETEIDRRLQELWAEERKRS